MKVLDSFIQSLQMDTEPHSHKNLKVHFLHRQHSRGLDILNYSEATEAGLLTVTEVEGGTVPELKFTNTGAFTVFVPEGSIWEGLKQSRSIRVSFLIPEHEEILIPVHCVEQHRWDSVKKGRRSSYSLNSRMRADNLKSTFETLKAKQGFDSRLSQGRAWEAIRKLKEKKERALGKDIKSKGDFVGDVYAEDKATVDEYIKTFTCPDTASGLIALIDEKVVGLDIFVDNNLFKKNYDLLISGLAVEAINHEVPEDNNTTIKHPKDLLRAVLSAKQERLKAIGHGFDIRLQKDNLVGCALVAEDVYHLEAFQI